MEDVKSASVTPAISISLGRRVRTFKTFMEGVYIPFERNESPDYNH